MALRAMIYKAELQVSDIDRGHYGTHSLTIARHPSETEERLMVRLLAFALHADEALVFGRGLSSGGEEPDLVRTDDTGAIELWIEVGMPEEKWVRKACGRAGEVVLIAYGSKAGIWWAQQRDALARHDNLVVLSLDGESTAALGALAARAMNLTVTIQDGQAWVTAGDASVAIEPQVLKGRAG